MTTYEYESIRDLADNEINAVSGGQFVIGPISPEPPITPIIPLSGFSNPPGSIAPHTPPMPIS